MKQLVLLSRSFVSLVTGGRESAKRADNRAFVSVTDVVAESQFSLGDS
jgi:hypothetical protein